MEYIIICSVAFIISGLSLFSGFGLGTVLMPVFAIFFPVYIAISLTAIVHLFNSMFKFLLLGKYADKSAIIRFGLPAIFSALLGALALFWLSSFKPLASYRISTYVFQITSVKLVVSILMILFSLFELLPRFQKISFDKKYLPLGGILSGFFGGLSGHQGALRSAFLIKCGLTKESFIATGVTIGCLVDLSRIFIYNASFPSIFKSNNIPILAAATISAFIGAFIGNSLIKKVTIRMIQFVIAIMLIAIAIVLGAGII